MVRWFILGCTCHTEYILMTICSTPYCRCGDRTQDLWILRRGHPPLDHRCRRSREKKEREYNVILTPYSENRLHDPRLRFTHQYPCIVDISYMKTNDLVTWMSEQYLLAQYNMDVIAIFIIRVFHECHRYHSFIFLIIKLCSTSDIVSSVSTEY